MKVETHKTHKGFTLIEVLVVVAIILTLGALVVLGIGKATRAARKTESINNIKQLSAISVADAGDNGGVFPEIHAGNLPFSFNQQWRDESNITRNMAYCSANECWGKEGIDKCARPRRDLWNYVGGEGDAERSYSLFGYACLTYNPNWTERGSFVEPDNWDEIEEQVTGENREVRWVPERTSQPDVAYPILWIDIAMNWNNQTVGNFLKKRGEVDGVHIGYLDGHVEWASGREVKRRFSTPGLTLFW